MLNENCSSDPYEIDYNSQVGNLSPTPALLSLSPNKQFVDCDSWPEPTKSGLSSPTGSCIFNQSSSNSTGSISNGLENGMCQPPPEVLNINAVRKRSEVVHTFPCYEVSPDAKLIPSFLSCTCSHMFVLHQLPHSPHLVTLHGRRALNSIVRITSKKSRPEVMTFSYGVRDENDEIRVWNSDKFLIPNSQHVIKRIEKLITNIVDSFSD